ncbi:hypothetical protein BT69DRAFT_1348021 [Atractiella rhizophila]|nr:hypothetical protein BT69DRAFT_1348021 [Atractiella rhizophila]
MNGQLNNAPLQPTSFAYNQGLPHQEAAGAGARMAPAGMNEENQTKTPPEGENPPRTNTASEKVTGTIPFKDQVAGYAKKFAGKTFGNEHEVVQGEMRLRGEDVPPVDQIKQDLAKSKSEST